jgi:hypothetical protein
MKRTPPKALDDGVVVALPRLLARLRRLKALDAPAIVIEWERQLIHRALARVSPSQGFAILGCWRELHRCFERGVEDDPRSTTWSRRPRTTWPKS